MTTAEDYRRQAARDADERHAPIVDAYESGLTMKEVGDEFGIAFQRVSQIIRRARERGLIDDKRRDEAVRRIDNELRSAIRQTREDVVRRVRSAS